MPPDPPSVVAPSALVTSFDGPTMGNSHYNITYLNQTKTFFFADIRSAQAQSAPPPPPPPAVKAAYAPV